MTPADQATVFVIDDDARMPTALERLSKSVGLCADAPSRLPHRRIFCDATPQTIRAASREADTLVFIEGRTERL